MANPGQTVPPVPSRELSPSSGCVVPLPPPQPDAVAATVRRRQCLSRWLDVALAGAVLLLAFLLSSFAIRNSDFWLHLASGRLLAEGRYHFGEDPFAGTTAGLYWTNHAWMFDLILYLLYQAVGGAGSVALKALLITALASLMLRIRRPNATWGLPAACTTLALLTMSPGLLMQPSCVSCFFLGLTLFWSVQPSPPRSALLRYGRLLLLFLLWVNVDSWFLLGLLLIALFWLGERLGDFPRHTPGGLIPASLTVCLINPHHVRAFTTFPAAFAPDVWASGLPQDPRFRPLFLSPWQLGDYLQPTVGLHAAGLAYFALTFLGLRSFALDRTSLRDWRLPVWAAFGLLAACQVQAIPFFAVVAGPITALNLQHWRAIFAHQSEAQAKGNEGQPLLALRAGSIPGQAALLLVVLVFLVLSWPGWLQAVPHERHRVAWEVDIDPSLRQMAQTLHQWRRQGLLSPGERVFLSHPDTAHYCAWFYPEEKGFLDHRFSLLAPVAQQYEAICEALDMVPSGKSAATTDWQQIMRDHGIRVVVVYDSEPPRLFAALRRLAQDPHNWTLLQVDGQTLAFGWNGAGGGAPRFRFDAAQLAYGSADKEGTLPPAADQEARRSPRPRGWWDRFARPAPPLAWESHAASVYLHYYVDRVGPQRTERTNSSPRGYAAGLTGLPALASGPWAISSQVLSRFLYPELFVPDIDDQPTALLLLTIRAARRALTANPDDANAWLRLGQAYFTLYQGSGERSRQRWQPIEVLGHIQAVTALEHALVLDPDLAPAHRALASLYTERIYLDSALEHSREALRLAQRGPLPGEEADAFRARLDQERQRVQALEQQVQERRDRFAIQSSPLDSEPLGKARLALRLGLARVALDDVLLQSPVTLLGGAGARLELELLLMLGRAEQVRDMLDDQEMRDNKHKLGEAELAAPLLPGYWRAYRLPAYEWLHFCQEAATGDYQLAASSLHEMLQSIREKEQRDLGRMRQALAPALASELGLSASPDPLLSRFMVRQLRDQMMSVLASTAFYSLEQADLNTLGGLLALEQDVPHAAKDYFQAAFAASQSALFAARPLAITYQRRLEAAREGMAH